MTKEGEEQEKKKLRRKKTRVGERKKLTEMRKSSSDRLFVLERDVSLAGDMCARTLECKSKETDQFK